MICLLKLLFLVILLGFNNNVLLSVLAVSNSSTASLLPYSSAAVSIPRNITNNRTQAITGATIALPANRTNGNVNGTKFDDQCLLWDPSCSGNRTSAIDKFFALTSQHNLLSDRCFVQAGSVNLANVSNCDGSASEFQEMKNWMRSQQCVSAAGEWAAKYESGWDPDSHIAVQMDNYEFHTVSGSHPSCCGACDTNVQNVDIYYWPEPDVNTSCLSIVGDSVRPVGYGATTSLYPEGTTTSTDIYWACDARLTTDYDTLHGTSYTYTTSTRTAMVRTIGTLLVKVYLSDPWLPSPCTESNVMSQGSNVSAGIREKRATMHPRAHTLVVPSSVSQNDSSPITTMVLDGFTFTSPSIYANFHGILATDQCGGVSVLSTMVAFAPGELATIAGPLGPDNGFEYWTTKSFNLNDLPCPPQSVMEANWYKPQPGEPYRPLIALPSRLKKMIPWLSHCEDELFTAYDPPTALTAGKVLVPPISYSDPKVYPLAPVPSPTLSPGGGQKVGVEASVPAPASGPTLDQPKATVTPALAPSKQKEPDPGPQSTDPATQESAASQPTLNAVGSNNDPKGSNDPQRNSNLQPSSDPKAGNDPGQGSSPNQNGGTRESEGVDPKPNSVPHQVDSSQGSGQSADPVLQNTDPEQTEQVNSLHDSITGQTKTINNQPVQLLSHGISIAGTTLTPGAPPITVSGTPIHFDSSAFVIGTSTLPFTPKAPIPITTTIAGHVITAASNAIAVAGTTLTPGAPPITVSGTPIHFDPSALVVGSSTVSFVSPAPTQLITTIAGQAITAAPTAVAIAGTSLSPGAPGTTIDGTVLSLDEAGQFVVGSKTIPFTASTVPKTITTIIAGQPITAAPNAITLAGTTLSPGSPGTTLGGTVLSLNTASQLIIGSQTVPLSSSILHPPITTTIGNQAITAFPNKIAIAGTALTPGAPGVTVGGTLVSLNNAGGLIVGSKTMTLGDDESGGGGEGGLGGLVMGGFGSAGPFGTGSPTVTLTQGNISTSEGGASGNGTGNGTSAGVQIFQGKAAGTKGRCTLLWNQMVILSIMSAMAILTFMC